MNATEIRINPGAERGMGHNLIIGVTSMKDCIHGEAYLYKTHILAINNFGTQVLHLAMGIESQP